MCHESELVGASEGRGVGSDFEDSDGAHVAVVEGYIVGRNVGRLVGEYWVQSPVVNEDNRPQR